MDSFAQDDGVVYVGMDTSKEKVAVAVLWPGVEKPVTDVIANDEAAIRHYFSRWAEPALRCGVAAAAGRPSCTTSATTARRWRRIEHRDGRVKHVGWLGSGEMGHAG